MSEREVKKIAAAFLRSMNQGLQPIGSATGFRDYVNTVYIPYLCGYLRLVRGMNPIDQ
jgi:hypothetical protein